MWLINCFSDVYLGAHWPKSVPLVCPLGAPQENSTTAFAYTRTVVWAYANGCSGIRKRLFGRTQTVITLRQTPRNSVPFSCFGGTLSLNKGTLTTKETKSYIVAGIISLAFFGYPLNGVDNVAEYGKRTSFGIRQ